MSLHIPQENSLAEIIAGKDERRDALLHALSQATPADLEAAAHRLKEVMRDSKGNERRQRINPPRFSVRD